MPTLYQNFTTGDDTRATVFGATWRSQAFTPSITHLITSVKLKMLRVDSPGDITVSIRTTDGSSKPTGSDIDGVTGTTSGNNLTTAAGGEWREITLSAGITLNLGSQYAIIVRAIGASGFPDQYVGWRANSNGGYGGGSTFNSTNSGSSWISGGSRDYMFEEWGEPLVAPTVTTQAVSDILHFTATGNGNITDLGGGSVTQHGVCWNTSGTPTTADDKTEEGVAGATGAFTSSMTGLSGNTLYYVRAYATSEYGTSYGEEVTFTTLLAFIPKVQII